MLKPLKQPNIKDEQWVIPEKMMETETILSELKAVREEVEGLGGCDGKSYNEALHDCLSLLDERIARLTEKK